MREMRRNKHAVLLPSAQSSPRRLGALLRLPVRPPAASQAAKTVRTAVPAQLILVAVDSLMQLRVVTLFSSVLMHPDSCALWLAAPRCHVVVV